VKVRIGIADTSKVVELDVDDAGKFRKEVERALAEDGMAWFNDSKGRDVGIPAARIAFVEIEGADGDHAVGFAPAV
jgi:hypothetical protein